MGTFSYRAKDRKGELIEGVMDADNAATVTTRLQAMNYFPLEISDTSAQRATSAAGMKMLRRPRVADIAPLFRQMADMVGAGVALVRTLDIVAEQTPNEQLREILAEVSQDVAGGDTLAQALGKHPKVFSGLQCSMVRAGESGGMLGDVLERLADFTEQEEELRSRIWSALAYPLVMVGAGGVAIVVLVVVVIPRILSIFDSLDQALPLITVMLIGTINFIQGYWWAMLGGAGALVLGLLNLARTDEGRLWLDRLLLRTPLIGTVIVKREIGKFTRTLGSLLRNGVPILMALEIVTDVITNREIRDEIAGVPQDITQGVGMSRTLQGSKVFPPVVVNMIAVGEETGRLDASLLRIAESYERQVDRSVKTMTSLIEPLIIVFMAGVVGFLVIAMLLPIFSIDVAGG